MLKKLLASALVAGSICLGAPADAAVVFNYTQQASGSLEQMTVDILATKAITTVTVGGYHVPSYLQLTAISLTTSAGSGGTNLLSQQWLFTPAATNVKYGTYTHQYDDGWATGTNGLEFGSIVVGSYDGYSQSFASTQGDTYYLHFQYTQDYATSKNGLQIVTDQPLVQDPVLPVPEAGSWVMLVAGFGVVGAALRRRRVVSATASLG